MEKETIKLSDIRNILKNDETIKELQKEYEKRTNKSIEIKTKREGMYYIIGWYTTEKKADYNVYDFWKVVHINIGINGKVKNAYIPNEYLETIKKRL